MRALIAGSMALWIAAVARRLVLIQTRFDAGQPLARYDRGREYRDLRICRAAPPVPMFRPGAQSIGEANQAGAARAQFQGNASFDAATTVNPDVTNFGAANPAAANASAAAAAARGTIAPITPQQPNADLAPITPSIEATPIAPVVPILPITPSVPVGDPRARLEPLITPDGAVAATAASPSNLPAADVTQRADWARATAVPGSDSVTVTTERGETATLPSPADVASRSTPFRTNYRGPVNAEASRYTLWDGYYWYLSPPSGWHYWDGARWQRFRPLSTRRDDVVRVLSR